MINELTLLGKNRLAWKEKREPRLTNDLQAIIRPFVASRCDGDSIFLFHDFSRLIRLGVSLHFLDNQVLTTFGKKPLKPPFSVGHECIGEVVEVGGAVSNFKKGDVVIVPWAISCGGCPTCSSGFYSNCNHTGDDRLISAYGFGPEVGDWGGSVTDLLLVPFADTMLIPVPESVNPYHCSSLSDNIADAYRTVGPQLIQKPQAPVLVMGGDAKSIGLYAAYLAVVLGSSRVDYLDNCPTRLSIAQKVGANAIPLKKEDSLTRLSGVLPAEGYPIVVDASGSAKRLGIAIRQVGVGGTCTSTAFYLRKETPIPLWAMYTKSATFHIGLSHPRRDIPVILPLIEQGVFQPEKIITLSAGWEEAPKAYLEKTTKLVIYRNPTFPQNIQRYKANHWLP